MRKVISQVTYEACDLACWIYECKYVRGLSIEEMLQEKPEKETFVIAMNMILEQFEKEDAGRTVS